MLQFKSGTRQKALHPVRHSAVSLSIGLMGHYLDQNRLQQRLYRHRLDDILMRRNEGNGEGEFGGHITYCRLLRFLPDRPFTGS